MVFWAWYFVRYDIETMIQFLDSRKHMAALVIEIGREH